jgi:hypothetical protein
MIEEQNINEPQSPAFLQGAVMCRIFKVGGWLDPKGFDKRIHEIEVTEMELNYKKMIEMVNIRRKNDDKLNQLLSRVSMEAVESDIDKKLAFYKTMKSFIAK